MLGSVQPTTVEQLLGRARSVLGQKTRYRLGAGNHDPSSPRPFDDTRECDCSGYVTWALGLSRYQPHLAWLRLANGGWYNTAGMWLDVREPTGFLAPLSAARPGAVLVYPAASVSKTKGPTIGHVGIVTGIKGPAVTWVIHCSAGAYRRSGDAIRETPPSVFAAVKSTRLGWPVMLEAAA